MRVTTGGWYLGMGVRAGMQVCSVLVQQWPRDDEQRL